MDTPSESVGPIVRRVPRKVLFFFEIDKLRSSKKEGRVGGKEVVARHSFFLEPFKIGTLVSITEKESTRESIATKTRFQT